jgi:hypothetical protein
MTKNKTSPTKNRAKFVTQKEAILPKTLTNLISKITGFLPLPKSMLSGAVSKEDYKERLDLDVTRYGAEYTPDSQQVQQGIPIDAKEEDIALILYDFTLEDGSKTECYYLAKCFYNDGKYVGFQFYDNSHRPEKQTDFQEYFTHNHTDIEVCIVQRAAPSDPAPENKGEAQTQKQMIRKMAEDQAAQNELMQKHVTEIKTMVDSLKRPATRDERDDEMLQTLKDIKESLKQPKTSIGQTHPQHQPQAQQQQQLQPSQMTWPQQYTTRQPPVHPSRNQHAGAKALQAEQDRQYPQFSQAAQVLNSGYHRQENWMTPWNQPTPQPIANDRNTHLQAAIRGVPYTKNENLRIIVDKIIQLKCLHGGAFVGAVNPRAIYPKDYTCRRALKENAEPDPNKAPPAILVTFTTAQQKLDFVRHLFSEKKTNEQHMTINDICPDLVTEENKTKGIYINENLTPKQSDLFYLARQRKKTTAKPENPYLYVWTKNGIVYVKKSETARAQIIRDGNDLPNNDTG